MRAKTVNKIDFDLQLPAKVENLEKQVKLIERKIACITETLESPNCEFNDLYTIELEEKKTLAESDLLAKKDWLRKLKAKLKTDEKQFQRDISEGNNQWRKVVDIAEKWISETEEKQSGKASYQTIMVAFIIDNLTVAYEGKEIGAKVHYYNLLKKQLVELGVWS